MDDFFFAFDTNRLAWPAPRRFYSTWRERARHRTRIMPTVAAELMKDLDLRLLSRSVYETTERLATTAMPEIDRFTLERQLWWANELLNPQSQYELVRLTPDQYRIATEVRTSISAACFPTVDRRDVPFSNDTLIVSEALATGHDVLITANMKSIDHEKVNQWIRRNHNAFQLKSAPLVHHAEEFFIAHSTGPGDLELTKTVLAASWGPDPDAHPDDTDHDFQEFATTLADADLPETSNRALSTWERHPAKHELIEDVRSHLATRTRIAEAKLPATHTLDRDDASWSL
jgi:hypothetical protein